MAIYQWFLLLMMTFKIDKLAIFGRIKKSIIENF